MSDPMIPDAFWSEHPDPAYDQECPTCGALVDFEKRGLHRAWHIALMERTDRYVDPPRYGGHQR